MILIMTWPFETCENWPTQSASYSVTLITWLRFLLTETCAQQALAFLLHLSFLLPLVIWLLYTQFNISRKSRVTIRSGQVPNPRRNPQKDMYYVPFTFLATEGITQLVSTAFMGLSFWELYAGRSTEANFFLLNMIVWATFTSALFFERQIGYAHHWHIIRVWWVVTFLITWISFVSATARLHDWTGISSEQKLDDVVTFATFPPAMFLLLMAYEGKTGISVSRHRNDPSEPLLQTEDV